MEMIRCLFCAAVLAILLLPNVQAQKTAKPAASGVENPFTPFTHFSATMSGGIIKDEPRKIYRSGNLFRVDLDGLYHITDLATNTTWSVHPDRCTHVSSPDVRSYPFSAYRDFQVERSPSEDKETVDGHPCKIETVTFAHKESEVKVKMKLWKADDLQGFPIKIELPHQTRTTTVNYTNVSLDTPDAKLFELPAKCQEFSTGAVKGTKKPPAKSSKPPEKTAKP